MHMRLGFRLPSERGIFRYGSEAAAQPFLEHAKAIGLANEVNPLTEREARTALGNFFEARHANFEVPDCPFDIAGLMNAARDRARAHGATFRIDRVDVRKAPDAPNGYRLHTAFEMIDPRFAVICTGSATPAILEHLGLPHPLVINRSSLLVLPSADGMSAALLADRSRKLSVVRHGSVPPRGRLVVGDKGRTLVRPVDGLTRRLTRGERADLLACVPPQLRRPDLRATACHKTDYRRQDGKATVEPWVESYPEYPGLIFATPGKATMALHTAERVLRELSRPRGRQAPPRSTPGNIGPPPGNEWREPIRTHFHPAFDGIDDTESGDDQ